MSLPRSVAVLVPAVALALVTASLLAQSPAPGPAPAPATRAARVTTPVDEWGHQIGDDYFVANYQQLVAYWRKLERESPRVHLVEIGRTSRNRPHLMAILTSPQNYTRIARYKDIAARLARAEGLTDDEARALAKEGKAVVWIDGGLHATEVLGAQQLLELVYQFASGTDEETTRILEDVIILAVTANPDGMDLVSDWYMQHGNTNIPVLYNHYAGHDDNRDFYMSALAESTNMNRVMYREWYPQIMYNHHQTGPQGTVMFAPPFRDPFNYFFHPNIPAGIDMIGSVMAQRFISEHKPGVTSRKGQDYSTWWNGGLRTTAYFHNMIGILTEAIGNPTPTSIPFIASRQIPDSNVWWPIPPQEVWHFRQSIDYSMTANLAVLDYASRYRETVLYRIYEMGRDEIAWGNEDHWTFTPHEMARVQAALAGPSAPAPAGGRGAGGGNALYAALTTKELRDPRGFILPADQADFGTATKFVNALLKTGVDVLRATAPFSAGGRTYPANSYVVKTAQAFRPHVMDMFEPQDHPDDIPFPGATPTPPYDNAGYTLAFQMGVQFDRVLEAFDGAFVKVPDLARPPAGRITGAEGAAGYYFTHRANDSFIAVNRLLTAGEEVSWLRSGPMGPGTFYVVAKPTTLPILQRAAAELGLSFQATPVAVSDPGARLRPLRIGLYDQYGGSMPSGWTRLILEEFEFSYEVVYPPMLTAGNLRSKYDVIVFNGAGIPNGTAGGGGRGAGGAGAPPTGGDAPGALGTTPAPGRGADAAGGRGAGGGAVGRGTAPGGGRANFTPQPIPAEYAARQGQVTAQTMDQLRSFVDEGGTVVAIGSAAANAVGQFNVPVSNHLAGVGRQDYYVPGSVLRVAVDRTTALADGIDATVDVFFDNDPVFKLNDDAAGAGARRVAWFADATPLRSGWAWGAKYLDKGAAIVETTSRRGRVFLFGPEILFRAQPHGTFKFFFNALYLSVTPAGF